MTPERREFPRRTIWFRNMPPWITAALGTLVSALIIWGLNALNAHFVQAETFTAYQAVILIQHQRDSMNIKNRFDRLDDHNAREDSVLRDISCHQRETAKCR